MLLILLFLFPIEAGLGLFAGTTVLTMVSSGVASVNAIQGMCSFCTSLLCFVVIVKTVLALSEGGRDMPLLRMEFVVNLVLAQGMLVGVYYLVPWVSRLSHHAVSG